MGPLPEDAAAMPLWQGSAEFDGQNATGSATVHAIVEYAVYAPGAFDDSLDLNTPLDPSGGEHYVYAYQVFNIGGESTDTRVSTLSVDLVPDVVPPGDSFVGHDSGVGGFAPISSVFVGVNRTNVKWTFSPTGTLHLLIGENSNILYFTSPYGPQWLHGTVGGTQASADTQPLPSPVPEPATIALAATAALGLLAARYFRRPSR
jgi:hypothetical protein